MRHAVILAGGSGTRLWPASRRRLPKQFLRLGGDESLLAATVRRARDAVDGQVVVVTGADHAALVHEHAPGARVVVEPAARNTAAAIGLAALHLVADDPAAVLAVLPADHHVGDEPGFAAVLARAFAAAAVGDRIVTVGIVPDRPETGFGYLELGAETDGVREVVRFVEKPDRATATAYLASGRFLWNGGMFFAAARRLLDDVARLLPRTWQGLAEIVDALAAGASPARLAEVTAAAYAGLPSISIDHGVMERTHGVVTVPADVGWSDIGSWDAVAALHPADAAGNVLRGPAVTADAAGNLVMGDPDGVVALVGVSGLVVVKAGDAVLVVPRERAQDVRLAVDALARAGLERYL
jgi:mannose-1-phosphate guanylyltransferase